MFIGSLGNIAEPEGGEPTTGYLQAFAQIKNAEVEEQRNKLVELQDVFQQNKDILNKKELKVRQVELVQKNRTPHF